MKTSIARGKSLQGYRITGKKTGMLLMIISCCFCFNELKSQSCDLCKIPAFPSLTIYQAFQTGHGMGFGVEAGNWKKDAGHFSYFIGTSMVWTNTTKTSTKTNTGTNQTMLTFYLKGQYKITSHLYVIAAPGIVNLSYLEMQAGFRYVIPITQVIAIGVEPAYAFGQKQMVINANMHFALL
jgi:hypothetical protein